MTLVFNRWKHRLQACTTPFSADGSALMGLGNTRTPREIGYRCLGLGGQNAPVFGDGKSTVHKGFVTQMIAGDVAVVLRIHSVRGAGKRLADMGFVQGARLEMVKPGRPCIVRVNACCIALGNEHQEAIELNVSEPRTHLVA